MSNINLSPGAFPRYLGQHPISLNRTRVLTESKCNIWRACVKEATYLAIYNNRPHSSISHLNPHYSGESK